MDRVVGNTKWCSKCKKYKPFSAFAADKTSKIGLQSRCRECQKQWRDDNIEKARESSRLYGREHKEEARARANRWNKNNREKSNERARRWRAANSEKFKVVKRESRRRHPEVDRARVARRRMRKVDNNVVMTKQDILESRQHRLAIKDDPCHYCGEVKDIMQDDHKIPIAKGGTDHAWNIVRACADCNNRKNDKTYEEFMEEIGR